VKEEMKDSESLSKTGVPEGHSWTHTTFGLRGSGEKEEIKVSKSDSGSGERILRDIKSYIETESPDPDLSDEPSDKATSTPGHGGNEAAGMTDPSNLALTLQKMIGPNPIIVNSSSITGVFDIQRVIVSFTEEEKSELREKIMQSDPSRVLPFDCQLSTVCAVTTVKGSCTAEMLRKQLDLCDVVDGKIQAGMDENQENAVSRMMELIQRIEDVSLVAGEWVLARFSGVPGAN
jgi:hypothetical protein